MTRLASLVILAALAGCSVWNAPDPNRLDGGPRPDAPDAGFDAPPIDAPMDDSDAPEDAGVDAPDGGPPRVELDCDDTRDDDGDGFVDCLDTEDCASDVVACCRPGAISLTETWAVAALTGWSRLPSGGDGPNAPTSGGYLSSFSSGRTSFARAVIRDPAGLATGCIAIDPGVHIETDFRLEAPATPTCTGCEERAGILLTSVQPATAVASYTNGDTLLADLAVTMYRVDGASATMRLEVTIGGSVVETLDGIPANERVVVAIDLAPEVVDGVPMSLATITATETVAGMTTPLLERHPALLRADLLGPVSGCADGRGLYLAVEGVGNRVGVGAITVREQVCANPNHFREVGSPVDATALAATPAWSTGGLGAPAIFYTDETSGPGVTDRWDVLFDASDRNRANELIATVRFAVGGAIVGDDAFSIVTPRRSGAPIVAEAFPVCGTGCTESNRDPDFWIRTDAERHVLDVAARLVWARRRMDGVSEIRHDLLQLNADARAGIGSDTVLLTTAPAMPGFVEGCTGLRSPSLVSRPGGFWLLFVCEHGTSAPDVRVAELSPTGTFESVSGAPIVLRTDGSSSYASLGIFDVDAETWITGTGTNTRTLLRAWFVGRNGTSPSIGLAEAVLAGEDPTFEEPLTMFGGNPVITSDDDRLPTCTDTCRVTGVTATRTADPRDVRFLVAFTDEATAATQHLLVPLDQTLPAP